MKNLFLILITSFFLVNCNNPNPMIKQWSDKNSEFGGVPAFNKMSPKLVKEAMLKGMELSLNDIDKIANNLSILIALRIELIVNVYILYFGFHETTFFKSIARIPISTAKDTAAPLFKLDNGTVLLIIEDLKSSRACLVGSK